MTVVYAKHTLVIHRSAIATTKKYVFVWELVRNIRRPKGVVICYLL